MMLSQCGNVVAFKFFNQDGFICFSFIAFFIVKMLFKLSNLFINCK